MTPLNDMFSLESKELSLGRKVESDGPCFPKKGVDKL